MEKTLADFPALMFKHRVHRDARATFDPANRATEVLAPCCGRRVIADAILDVRGVLGTIVKGGGHQGEKDHDWLCDGCRDRMLRDTKNAWTPSKLFAACGARPEAIRSLKLRERLDEMERADHAAGRPHDPIAAHHRAAKELET